MPLVLLTVILSLFRQRLIDFVYTYKVLIWTSYKSITCEYTYEGSLNTITNIVNISQKQYRAENTTLRNSIINCLLTFQNTPLYCSYYLTEELFNFLMVKRSWTSYKQNEWEKTCTQLLLCLLNFHSKTHAIPSLEKYFKCYELLERFKLSFYSKWWTWRPGIYSHIRQRRPK